MPWVVDTCVLIDILDEDPSFGLVSAEALDACQEEGLVICPVTYAELAPAFQGDPSLQDEFLGLITRNPDDFSPLFPELPLRVPG